MARSIFLSDPEATDQMARAVAVHLKPGDTILLEGDIGAGKSHFARAVIRAIVGEAEDVPSPTFTLVQVYDGPDCEIWHSDLYRLTSVAEVDELGLFEAFETAICLVEWPDILGNDLPQSALRLTFEARATDHRMTIHAPATWQTRLEGLL